MPTATQDDPVLTNLFRAWQSKHDAAELIIDNPSSTGEALVKAEKLFDERDRIGEQIQDRQHKLQAFQNLKDRYSAGDSWSREPQRTLRSAPRWVGVPSNTVPTRAAGDFRLSGWQPAGYGELIRPPAQTSSRWCARPAPAPLARSSGDCSTPSSTRRTGASSSAAASRRSTSAPRPSRKVSTIRAACFPGRVHRADHRPPAGPHLPARPGRDPHHGARPLVMPRKQYAADDQYTTAFRATWTGEIPYDGTGNIGR